MPRIFVAGHRGMVGSAICRKLALDARNEILIADRRSLDLCCQTSVRKFFETQSIDQVYLAAAKVGGIKANAEYPAEFIYENLLIQANVMHAAYLSGVKKLLFLGSSCIYPKFAEQPISEASLLTGPLEPTNEPYAVAKIAGIKMCESYNRQYGVDFRSIMPTNLYGPGDNFHPELSHVLPALLSRFHEAVIKNHKKVQVWGTGLARREFLYVDDLASAAVFIANLEKPVLESSVMPMQSHINVGVGVDISIAELAETISSIVGYHGEIEFNPEKPDGTPRKLLNTSILTELGWSFETPLLVGIQRTYDWYLDTQLDVRT